MNQNYSDNFDELTKNKSGFARLRSAFMNPKFLIYSAIIIILLLISSISKSQTYTSSLSPILVINCISNPTNMEPIPDGTIFGATKNISKRICTLTIKSKEKEGITRKKLQIIK